MKKHLFILKIAVFVLGIFFSTSAKAFTAVTSGNWSSTTTWGGIAPGTTVSNQDIIIPVGITVTLDQDVTFSGLISSFTVDGTLSSTSSNWVEMSSGQMTGDGTVSIRTLTFNTLSSCTFSGDLLVSKMVNRALSLTISAVANVGDTLFLEAGALTLGTNGNLTMATNSTIKVEDGSMAISGGVLNLNNNYHTMYVGSSKTTGIEMNATTMQQIYLRLDDNNQILTLNGDVIVNGNADMSSGKIALNGNKLTLRGDLMTAMGSSLTSTAASDIVIEGSGMMSSMLMFTGGSSINSLVINRTGSGMVKLGSALNVAGELHLTEGAFSIENGGDLTMNAGSTIRIEEGGIVMNTGSFDGTAAYNVEYLGTTNAAAGIELSGSGLNNLTVNYTAPGPYSVMLTDSTSVGGHMNLISGTIVMNAQVLMLNGTLSQNHMSTFSGGTGSELHLNLTSVTNDTLFFDQGTGFNLMDKLVINTAGTGHLVIGSNMFIGTEMRMLSGSVELTNNSNLTITPSASIIGYNENRYIITDGNISGSLAMNVIAGSTYVTFPVGTSTSYAPAQIQQEPGSSTGYFSVNAMNTVLSNATSGIVSSDFAKMVDKTWFINTTVPVLNSNLKLGWMAGSEVNGFDRSNAYIMNYGGSAWDVITPSAAGTGLNNTYELTRMGITSLNPAFAVTEDGQPININEVAGAAGFDLYPNPSGAIVTIEAIGSKDNFKYELTDLSGRLISANEAGNTHSFDVQGLDAGYYFVRITNLNTNESAVKKFIKE
ncbi:MAG: hypothetical protein K0S33_670 [Bacteroidetes bacterium]|jgi:hypothetical protein|nr:hypothetical protein [Bacteroidota bacterium]